jgi:hypothetical protein
VQIECPFVRKQTTPKPVEKYVHGLGASQKGHQSRN